MKDSLNVVYLQSELRSSQVINLNKAFFITCLVLEYPPTVLPGLVLKVLLYVLIIYLTHNNRNPFNSALDREPHNKFVIS